MGTDKNNFTIKANGGESVKITPDGGGNVTICCESGSSVEISFNAKHLHFHRVAFKAEEIVEIVKGA